METPGRATLPSDFVTFERTAIQGDRYALWTPAMRIADLFAALYRRFGPSGRPEHFAVPPGLAETETSAEEEDDFLIPQQPSARLDPMAFAARLIGMGGQDGADLENQRLHVLSLSDYKKAVGEKWERLTDLVEAAVDGIVESHIDRGTDLFTQLDPETACLVMPEASRKEARSMVAAIAQDISGQLIGDMLIGGRRPQVVATNMSLADVLGRHGLRTGAIRAAIERAAPSLGVKPANGDGTTAQHPENVTTSSLAAEEIGDLSSLFGAVGQSMMGGPAGGGDAGFDEAALWLDSYFQTSRLEVRHFEADPKKSAEIGTMRHESKPRKDMEVLTFGPKVRSEMGVMSVGPKNRGEMQILTYEEMRRREMEVMRIERQRLMALREAGPTADAQGWNAADLTPDTSLALVWTPTWVTNRHAIDAFHARIIRQDGPGAPTKEGVQAYQGLSPVEVLILDRFTAASVARTLTSLSHSGKKIGLTVPIHWTSLAPRWRDCIRMPFEDCPPKALRRFLKIEIFGLSPAMPVPILRDLAGTLEKLGCDVIARLPLSRPDMIFSLRSVRAIGVDLAELDDADRVGDDELFARLEAFRAAAREAHLACYVWSVRRRPMIDRLVRAGYSLVNGPGVMGDVGQPHSIH